MRCGMEAQASYCSDTSSDRSTTGALDRQLVPLRHLMCTSGLLAVSGQARLATGDPRRSGLRLRMALRRRLLVVLAVSSVRTQLCSVRGRSLHRPDLDCSAVVAKTGGEPRSTTIRLPEPKG